MATAKKWNNSNYRKCQKVVDDYFQDCEINNKVPSVVGLALALGFTCRQALERYTDRKSDDVTERCVVIITQAKARIEEYNIQLAYNRDASPGARFILQNGFNYSEKQDITIQQDITVTVDDD